MPLDLTILESWHFALCLTVFVITFVLLFFEQNKAIAHIPRVGVLLATVITIPAFFILDDSRLSMSLAAAALLTIFIGTTDDRRPLSARAQLGWQAGIAALLVGAGWTIPYITNPTGPGVLPLDLWQSGSLLIPGSILAFLWIMLLINSINWIDGSDGLAGSILSITHGSLIAISLLPATQDPKTLSLAIVGLAATLAFTIWNFSPARVYLGTTGSWFLAIYTALVAMLGGGKMITSIIVLAIPILDVLVVVIQRLLRHQQPWQGDTIHHLHHRLSSLGISTRTITLMAIAITSILAIVAIFATTLTKITTFSLLALGFIAAAARLALVTKKSSHV